MDELAEKGLKIEHYADSDTPIFELIEGDGDKAVTHALFAIPEILRVSDQWRLVLYGVALLLIINFMPDGLEGLFRKRRKT